MRTLSTMFVCMYFLFIATVSMVTGVAGLCLSSGTVTETCEWSPWSVDCRQCCGSMEGGFTLRTRSICCLATVSWTDCGTACDVTHTNESEAVECSEVCRTLCVSREINKITNPRSNKRKLVKYEGQLEGFHGSSFVYRRLLALDTADDKEDCESGCKAV